MRAVLRKGGGCKGGFLYWVTFDVVLVHFPKNSQIFKYGSIYPCGGFDIVLGESWKIKNYVRSVLFWVLVL